MSLDPDNPARETSGGRPAVLALVVGAILLVLTIMFLIWLL